MGACSCSAAACSSSDGSLVGNIRAAHLTRAISASGGRTGGGAFRDDIRPHPFGATVSGFQPHVVLVTCSVIVSQVSRRSKLAHTRPGLEPAASAALRRFRRRRSRSQGVRSDGSATPGPRIHHAYPWIHHGCSGTARCAFGDVCGDGARFCGLARLSLSRLRRSTARDRRAVRRGAAGGRQPQQPRGPRP
jgi:hypothetical protein